MRTAILVFILLTLPYQGLVTNLDGRHDLVNSLLVTHSSVHPPLKGFFLQLFFNLFGIYSYTWIGFLIGIAGIVGIYLLTKLFTNNRAATTASLLLATCGLYVSTSLFSMTDFIVTVLAIYVYYFYYTQRINYYIIFCALGILTKETFLLVPLSVLIVAIFQKKLRWQYFHPFIVFIVWVVMIHFFHLAPWNQQNFSEFKKYGSLGTVFLNIVTLKIFNKFAFGAWLQMLVLNFNWVFWLLALVQLRFIKWSKSKFSYYSPIVLFMVLYILLVLSFPTWIIPRYMLPIWPFLLIFISAHLWKNKVMLAVIPAISFISLFYSIDPVSHAIYKERQLFKETFYQVEHAGNDGITYNMQYLDYTKRVNKEFFKEKTEHCYDVFLSMGDDKDLRSIYHFPVKPCS